MIRKHPDAFALAVLVLALAAGLPSTTPRFSDVEFRALPALHASTARAGERVDRWLERFEERRDRVWERLDRRMRELEQRFGEKEASPRIRTASS